MGPTDPSQLYSPRIADALAFAAEAFRDKTRKGSEIPYLSHLLQVMVHVAEHGGDEDQMVAALLHDYLEDIDGEGMPLLTDRFGARVADLVLRLSDATTRPKPTWEARKSTYVRALRDESPDLKLIGAADKLHNAVSVLRDYRRHGEQVFARFVATRGQTLWYYRAVTEALEHGYESPLVGHLRYTVGKLHRLAEVPWDGPTPLEPPRR